MARFTDHWGGDGWQNIGRVAVLTACCLATMAGSAALVLAAGEAPFEVLRNQVYVERESGPLTADVFVPAGDGPFPAVLVVHGGAWAHGTKEQLASAAQALAGVGYTTAAISYRLAPQHRFPAQIYDCQAAVRWLRSHAAQFKVDPNHIGGYGYSAGGHLVAMLGALDDDDFREPDLPADAPSARLQVVVAGGAPCDFMMIADDSPRLAYWLGGTPAEKRDVYRDASPSQFVTADDPPMFFFHGTSDELVSIDSPRRMVERLSGVGVVAQMYEVPKANHLLAAMNQDALGQALAFTNRYLKVDATTIEQPTPGPESEQGTAHGQ
jgi:acetyl esterase/lipase